MQRNADNCAVVVERLRTRRVWIADSRALFNVNTPADRGVLLQCTAATTR